MEIKRVRTAVFPVAGLGTRFLPATKAMPKEMLTVVDRPLIQYAVDEAREAGIEHFVFVTGRNKGVIEDHFDRQFELDGRVRGHRVVAQQDVGPDRTEAVEADRVASRELAVVRHAGAAHHRLAGTDLQVRGERLDEHGRVSWRGRR